MITPSPCISRIVSFVALFILTTQCPAGSTQPAELPPALQTRIVAPADKWDIWINESMDVRAQMTLDGGKTWLDNDPQHKWSIAWITNTGSYVEQFASHTTYIAGDYDSITDGMRITLNAILIDEVLGGLPPPTTMPATRLSSQATFATEIDAADKATDRDQKVAHLRNALAQRPDDPDNLKIEFDMAVELGQRNPSRERESLAVFEDIVKRFDHQKYYSIDPENFSESTQSMVPRAAILCSSILNALHDNRGAREYDEVAMNDLRWTFEKRKFDLLNAPKPRLPSNQIAIDNMRPGELEHQIDYWRKQRASAAAGGVDLLGPYGKALVEATVNQYRQSFGPFNPTDLSKIMRRIVHDFPNTPLATEARKAIDATRPSEN